jgi:crossover junction endodeoxyribonuclease RusA
LIELWLPYPPSANHLWRSAKGRVFKSRAYVDWLLEAGLQAKSQRAGSIKGPYKLSVTAARPDKRKRDIDNLLKPISDLLKSIGAIEDDYLCEMISARWVTNGDGVAVRIEPAGLE